MNKDMFSDNKGKKVMLNKEYINQLSNQGEWNQLAISFLEEIKNREISPENLEKLIPFSTSFVSEMASVIRSQIESDKESYKAHTNVINSIVEALKKALSDGKIDKDERKDITNKLIELGKIMAEVDKSRNQESEKTKRLGLSLVTLFILILTVLSGGRFKPKSA